MRALKLFVAAVLGLGGLVIASQAPAAAKAPDETLTVTAPVQAVAKLRSTPITGGFSNYCAVLTLVPFNEVHGYAPVSVTVTFVNSPRTESIGPAPYDDGANQDGIAFPPSGAQHQTQIGDATYQQGGGDPAAAAVACEELRQRSDDFFAPTATITYEATGKCASAIDKLAAAEKAVKKAKKKAANTTGQAHTNAVAALNQAKAKLKAAKKKAKKAC